MLWVVRCENSGQNALNGWRRNHTDPNYLAYFFSALRSTITHNSYCAERDMCGRSRTCSSKRIYSILRRNKTRIIKKKKNHRQSLATALFHFLRRWTKRDKKFLFLQTLLGGKKKLTKEKKDHPQK